MYFSGKQGRKKDFSSHALTSESPLDVFPHYQPILIFILLMVFNLPQHTLLTFTLLIVCSSATNSMHSLRCGLIQSEAQLDIRLWVLGLYVYLARSSTRLVAPIVPPASMHRNYNGFVKIRNNVQLFYST